MAFVNSTISNLERYCSPVPNCLAFRTPLMRGFWVFDMQNVKYFAFSTLNENALRAFPLRTLKVVYAKFQHQHTQKAIPSKISNDKIFHILLQSLQLDCLKKKKIILYSPTALFKFLSLFPLSHFSLLSSLFYGSSSLPVADLFSSSSISTTSSSICPRRRQIVSDSPSNLRGGLRSLDLHGGGSWTILSPFSGFRWFRLQVIVVRGSQCFCGSL